MHGRYAVRDVITTNQNPESHGKKDNLHIRHGHRYPSPPRFEDMLT
jgi:hypothetical protein